MNIKPFLAVLLMLCGAGLLSSAHAADYRCLVYSGADGSKLEETSNGDRGYAVTAADLKAAEAGALKKGAQFKKGVVLTRAECTLAGATSGTATSQPAATASTAAPATGGGQYYCLIYSAQVPGQMGLPKIPAPAGKGVPEHADIWAIPGSGVSEEAAVEYAKAAGKPAVEAFCEASVNSLMNP